MWKSVRITLKSHMCQIHKSTQRNHSKFVCKCLMIFSKKFLICTSSTLWLSTSPNMPSNISQSRMHSPNTWISKTVINSSPKIRFLTKNSLRNACFSIRIKTAWTSTGRDALKKLNKGRLPESKALTTMTRGWIFRVMPAPISTWTVNLGTIHQIRSKSVELPTYTPAILVTPSFCKVKTLRHLKEPGDWIPRLPNWINIHLVSGPPISWWSSNLTDSRGRTCSNKNATSSLRCASNPWNVRWPPMKRRRRFEKS